MKKHSLTHATNLIEIAFQTTGRSAIAELLAAGATASPQSLSSHA